MGPPSQPLPLVDYVVWIRILCQGINSRESSEGVIGFFTSDYGALFYYISFGLRAYILLLFVMAINLDLSAIAPKFIIDNYHVYVA